MATELAPAAAVPLAPFCTLQVGGAAEWFAEVTAASGIAPACRWAAGRGLPLTVLGGGSNVVVSDRGVRGLVLRMSIRGVDADWDGDVWHVRAGAGEPWDALVETAVRQQAWGLECLSGIPGTVGGTPVQNVGAYGQDVSQTIDTVEVVERATGAAMSIPADACGFAYRDSRFRGSDRNRYIIAAVRFGLSRARVRPFAADVERELAGRPLVTPGDAREAVLALRRAKGMVVEETNPDARSVGSFFVNPVLPIAQAESLGTHAGARPPMFPAGEGHVKVPAAWLIEHAGWSRGAGAGPAGLSSRHALAIVNRGGASAEDVVAFATGIKQAVLDRFGVALAAEPIFLGFEDDARVAFLKGTGS